MSDKIKLLPCPFCGSTARLESNRDWHRIVIYHDERCIFLEPEVCMVPATDEQLQIAVADRNRRANFAQKPTTMSMLNENAEFEKWRSEQIASLGRMGYQDAANAFRNLGSIQWAGWQARAMLAAPAAPVALGIDGCGKPLCGGIEFAGGHHPLCRHHAAPAPAAQEPVAYLTVDEAGRCQLSCGRISKDSRPLYAAPAAPEPQHHDAVAPAAREPMNILHDEAGTASVENGSIAKAALAEYRATPPAAEQRGVVMPPRRRWDASVGAADNMKSAAWNEALDEVARLNSAPPAAEQTDTVKVRRRLLQITQQMLQFYLARLFDEGAEDNDIRAAVDASAELRALLGKDGEA